MSTKSIGFTLIELLVVIAIVAVLASIIFPAFNTVRNKARSTVCVSNQRQLGLGVMQYTQDNDELMPAAGDNTWGERVHGGWIYYTTFPAMATKSFDPSLGSLFPYVRNTAVYVCPDDAIGRQTGDSYAINSCVEKPTIVNGLRPGRHLAAFNNPASWILFCEEAYHDADTGSTNDGYFYWTSDTFSLRHNGGQNIAFIDGHVKWLLASDIIANQLISGGHDPTVVCAETN